MPYHAMHASNLDPPPTPGMPTMISARRDGARATPRGRACSVVEHTLFISCVIHWLNNSLVLAYIQVQPCTRATTTGERHATV
eukprot:SAG31_NODE_4035_length_3645_cov_1.508460_1_plen_82_part_10